MAPVRTYFRVTAPTTCPTTPGNGTPVIAACFSRERELT